MNKKIKSCPVCGSCFTGIGAISRKDNKTEMCSNCGIKEAIEIFTEYRKEKRNARINNQ